MNKYLVKNKCYVCQTKDSIFLKTIINKITLVSCVVCKIIYSPKGQITKKNLTDFYSKKYYNNKSVMGYSNYQSVETLHRKNANNLIDLASIYLKSSKKRVLDIGCAFGYALDEAKKRGFDVSGVETSKYSRAYAKNILKLNIFNDINIVIKKKLSFDLIFIIGTIEHFTDPKTILKKAESLLSKNGILLITTINTSGFFPLYSLKPPEHIFYFSDKNLNILLNKCGLTKIKHKTYFTNYFLYDVIHRLGAFFKFGLLIQFSKFIKKNFPNMYGKIPTNEMVFIVKKT